MKETVIKTIISIVAILVLASQANAMYVYWNSSAKDTFWNLDQIMWIEKKVPTTFWAEYWLWQNSSTGAYMGLQTNGTFFNGLPSGELAIFSVWNATGAQGFNCGKFSGEGVGYSCRVPFSIYTNTLYRYRIWIVGKDNLGLWWGAWILDGHTGNDVYIGSIRINASSLSVPQDFTEYFGPYIPCSQAAKKSSIAVWAPPTLNNGQYQSTYAGFGQSCSDIVTPQNYYRGVGD